MTPLTRYGRHLRIEVLLAVVAHAVALREFELGLLLGGAVIASGYVADGPRGRRLPRRVAGILGVGIAIWLVGAFLQRPDAERTMSIVGRLACLLATLRLYEQRGARDDRQVIALCVVCVIASILYSFEFMFGLVVLVFAVQTIHVLMLNRLRAGLDEAKAARRTITAESVVPPVEPATGRAPVLQFRLLVSLCALLAFLGAMVVFVLFPRQGDRMTRAIGMQTGFSTEVDLDRIDRIQQSNREVMTVTWLDPRGVPIRWPRPLLLRGAVLDNWDPAGHRWVNDLRSRVRRLPSTSGGLTEWSDLGDRIEAPSIHTQVISPRGIASPRLFSRWLPIAIATESPREVIFEPRRVEIEDATPASGENQPYAIQVVPTPSETVIAGVIGLPPAPIRTVEFPIPEVRAEAERILRERAPGLIDPIEPVDSNAAWRRRREIAEVFLEHLHGPDFAYTLDLRRIVIRRDVDPIVAFLTEHRQGHCEYFASAMCALCQSLGIEARVVTGFVAVEYDENLQHYVVRESNAHAWVEVRIGPYNWREYDPTAVSVLESLQADRRSWADDWRWLYDRFETFWNRRFVAFDGADQAALAERLGSATGDRARSILDGISTVAARVNRYFQLGPAGYIWLGVVAFALTLGVVVVLSVLHRRRRLRAIVGSARGLRLTEMSFYLDLLEAFELIGHPKPSNVSPLTHLAVVAAVRPDVAARAQPLVALFYDVRFGGRRLDAAERRTADEEARAIRALARESA
jgi:transglutaminase-like putative cysteine protease